MTAQIHDVASPDYVGVEIPHPGGHRVEWHIDAKDGAGRVQGTAVGVQPVNAWCRLSCPAQECSSGTFCDRGRVDAGGCLVVGELNWGEAIAEFYDGELVDLHSGPISVGWDHRSACFTWTYTAPESS